MEYYKKISKCRVCHSGQIFEILRFDDQYVASTFVRSNEDHPMSRVKIPLTVVLCEECGLVQLLETVQPDLLYKNYFYRSAISDTMRRDLRDVVDDTMSRVSTRPGDYAVDIGANDCTMISMFPPSLRRIAVEPAQNIPWDHVDSSIKIVNDYFSKDAVLQVSKGVKAKIVTTTAMFYDLDDPNKGAQDIKAVLDPKGICTIQVSYLQKTIQTMNFYDIAHEHLEYYTLDSISYLMERNGLSVFHASTNMVNGGSLRIFVTHQENSPPKSDGYLDVLAEEHRWQLRDRNTFAQFDSKVQELARASRDFILNEVRRGGLVIGLGASTKGNVLLQVCGIGKDLLPCISERNPDKVGLRTLGSDIEIISEEEARRLNPSTMLVIPWNFKEEIIKREQQYIQDGGKLLFLMPYLHYVDKEGEKKASSS